MRIILILLLLISIKTNASSDIAIIKKVKGSVSINGVKAKAGDEANIGDIVSTDTKSSFADVRLPNNNGIVRIVGGSIKIEKTKNKGSLISLLKGKLFSYFKKTEKKSNRKNIVKTEMASYGVRGTRFVVEIEDDEDFLCVCHGSVEAKNNSGTKVTLADGQYVYISEGERNLKNKIKNVWFTFYHKSFFKDMGVPLN